MYLAAGAGDSGDGLCVVRTRWQDDPAWDAMAARSRALAVGRSVSSSLVAISVLRAASMRAITVCRAPGDHTR